MEINEYKRQLQRKAAALIETLKKANTDDQESMMIETDDTVHSNEANITTSASLFDKIESDYTQVPSNLTHKTHNDYKEMKRKAVALIETHKKFKMDVGEDNATLYKDDSISNEIENKQSNEISNAPSQCDESSQRDEDKSIQDREFFVLDELQNGNDDCELSDDGFLSDSELYDMLDEGMKRDTANPEVAAEGEDNVERPKGVRKKIVLEEKNPNRFEVLPDGWIMVHHMSGMPVYLHRSTRVCTLSKPYFLGEDSLRNHKVPLSAIPCLQYRRALEKEKDKPAEIVVNGTTLPLVRVETAEENKESAEVSGPELNEYCKSLFKFKELEIMRFNSWPERRKYMQKQRKDRRPTVPQKGKLIMCPIPGKSNAKGNKEWVMNPSGKTFVCILHDYVQHALQQRPEYIFKELENTATPYLVVITIDGMEYGKGVGSSKKIAKMQAAKATLEILAPDIKSKIKEHPLIPGRTGQDQEESDYSFFDDIKIEDPRVMEFCATTTEPHPSAILLTCLQRTHGFNESNIKYEMKPIRHGKSQFTITVGNHSATVDCNNKRDGKQRASQALLQKLHPHVTSWGSLLRLYGNRSLKSMKEKKVEEQEITALQSRGNTHKPNYAIIKKLREEMLKQHETQRNVQPIGIFIPPLDVKMPNASSSGLSNVNL